MKRFLLCLCVAAFTGSKAQAPVFQWAKQLGGSFGDGGSSVISDANGNVYSVGSFSGMADLDPGPGTFTLNCVNYNAYLSKLDASGNFVWGLNLAQTFSNSSASGVALDFMGNVYVTGIFSGTADLNPGPATALYTSPGSSDDIFISKIDPSGNLLWTKVIGGNANEYSMSIATDMSAGCYVTGYFESTVDFDPNINTYPLTAGNRDIFVLRLDVAGNFIWAKQMAGTTTNAGWTVKTDIQGNVYVGGSFGGTVDFDPGPGTYPLIAAGVFDAFLTKLNVAGNLVWARQIGGTGGNDYVVSLDLDGAGNIFATGYYYNTTDFDPGPGVYMLSPVGIGDAYVSKFTNSGNFVWAKSFGGIYDDFPSGIALDNMANVYSAGYFQDVTDFDPGPGTYTLSTPGGSYMAFNTNGYISKLDSAGNFIWAGDFKGADTLSGASVASIFVDGAGSIYTTGYFARQVDFNPSNATYTLNGLTNGDAFVHKMNGCVAPPAPVNTTPPVNQVICAGNSTTLSASGTGTLLWYFSQSAPTAAGTLSTFITPPLSAGVYTYYVEAFTCTNSPSRTAVTVTASICTALYGETNPASQLYLFPNPSEGIVTISTEFSQPLSIEVYNAIGELLLKKAIRAGLSQIDLSFAAKGIYLIKLRDEAQVIAVKKLVKQ